MAHYATDLDLGTALAAPRACPACRATDLRAVCGQQGLVFLCPDCGRTWASELGALQQAEQAESSERPLLPPPRPEAPS